jgi:hypothetical protein
VIDDHIAIEVVDGDVESRDGRPLETVRPRDA